MHKITLLFLAAVTAVAITGCSSVAVVGKKDLNNQLLGNGATIAHLETEIWGLYLFSIPLLTGSADVPGKTVILEDTVNLAKAVSLTTAKSKTLKASQTMGMVSSTTTMPWMFGIKSTTVSANAIR